MEGPSFLVGKEKAGTGNWTSDVMLFFTTLL
jgi:hypothetical protein